jgi:hypothetical protein
MHDRDPSISLGMLLERIDNCKIKMMTFNDHGRYTEEDKRWYVELISSENDEQIKVARYGATLNMALGKAWIALESILFVGKREVLQRVLEHQPLREALDDHVPF